MNYLFDSRGHHIAPLMNRQLYNRHGKNVGQYLPQYGVFVDLDGRYLGETVCRDRLMYNLLSPYCTTNFGVQRGYERKLRPLAVPGDCEPIGRVGGHLDLKSAQLDV